MDSTKIQIDEIAAEAKKYGCYEDRKNLIALCGGIQRPAIVENRRSKKTQKPLVCKDKVPSDIEISQAVEPLLISDVAENAGILPEEVEMYGRYKAKIDPVSVKSRLKNEEDGYYVCVTGINPTPLGEGKSTTTVGLAQAIGAHLKRKVFVIFDSPLRVRLSVSREVPRVADTPKSFPWRNSIFISRVIFMRLRQQTICWPLSSIRVCITSKRRVTRPCFDVSFLRNRVSLVCLHPSC